MLDRFVSEFGLSVEKKKKQKRNEMIEHSQKNNSWLRIVNNSKK